MTNTANLSIDRFGHVHSTKEGGDITGFVLTSFIGLVDGLDVDVIEKPISIHVVACSNWCRHEGFVSEVWVIGE